MLSFLVAKFHPSVVNGRPGRPVSDGFFDHGGHRSLPQSHLEQLRDRSREGVHVLSQVPGLNNRRNKGL